ncbi:hypothetical protein [Streptosporangium sp. NPDC000396]|uniref:hypothetical protein n=1 Tax=Streptosporangium sp. NPDC000396 TaxID=3366185 RepID=UPI003696E429
MAGFEIYFDALEDCASKAKSVASQFKSVADENPASVVSSCFGALKGKSDKLIAAIGKLEGKIDSETRHVEQNLGKVEAALYKVVENVRKANHPGSRVEQA